MTQARTTAEAIQELVAVQDDGAHLVKSEVGALEAISRSEVAMQLDSAHRWPRSPTKFLREAMSLATLSVEIAETCMYSLPRGGKMITGPSVRLAEICAASWGNLHVGARVIDTTQTEVVAQAVAWDLEKNIRITVEAQRSIVGKRGRYDEDMIRVTGMAAISVALRNAIFRVIPRAYVDSVYDRARAVAVGDAKTLTTRRDDLLARLAKMGIGQERVLARLELQGVEDITLDHVETLIGLGTAIKGGEVQIDEAFPEVRPQQPQPSPIPTGTPEGKRIKLGRSKAVAPRETEGAAAAAPAPATRPLQPAPAAAVPASPPAPGSAINLPGGDGSEPVDLVELHETLAQVDDRWAGPGRRALIERWTEPERLTALVWAQLVLDDGPLELQSKRPPHTVLEREPGED